MKQSKIAELGMIDILYEMKNPLTNIRLALDFLEADTGSINSRDYHTIIKNSAIKLEKSIRDLCDSYHDLGITLHLPPDVTEVNS